MRAKEEKIMDNSFLKMISLNELEIELLRRKEQQKSTRPKLLENPDLSELQELCEEHIDQIECYVDSGDKEDEPDQCEYEDAVCEEIFSALYGDSIFKYMDTLYDSLKSKRR